MQVNRRHNCKFWNETGGTLLIILWMSCLLSPRATSLLSIAKTVSQQKKGQNLTRLMAHGRFGGILLAWCPYEILSCHVLKKQDQWGRKKARVRYRTSFRNG